jgi:hypothetical protein
MNAKYANISIILMVLLYLIISYLHKDRGGMQSIFQGALFQLSRKLQIFIQQESKEPQKTKNGGPRLFVFLNHPSSAIRLCAFWAGFRIASDLEPIFI